MFTVPHGFEDDGPAVGVDGIFDPQAVRAMTITRAAGAMATHFRIRMSLPLSHPPAPPRGYSGVAGRATSGPSSCGGAMSRVAGADVFGRLAGADVFGRLAGSGVFSRPCP